MSRVKVGGSPAPSGSPETVSELGCSCGVPAQEAWITREVLSEELAHWSGSPETGQHLRGSRLDLGELIAPGEPQGKMAGAGVDPAANGL